MVTTGETREGQLEREKKGESHSSATRPSCSSRDRSSSSTSSQAAADEETQQPSAPSQRATAAVPEGNAVEEPEGGAGERATIAARYIEKDKQLPIYRESALEIRLAMYHTATVLFRFLIELQDREFDGFFRSFAESLQEAKHAKVPKVLAVLDGLVESERPEWIEWIFSHYQFKVIYCSLCRCVLSHPRHATRHVMAHIGKMDNRKPKPLTRALFARMQTLFGAEIVRWEQEERAGLLPQSAATKLRPGHSHWPSDRIIAAFNNRLSSGRPVVTAGDRVIRASVLVDEMKGTEIGASYFESLVDIMPESETACRTCGIATGGHEHFLRHLQSYEHVCKADFDMMTLAVVLNPGLVEGHLAVRRSIVKSALKRCRRLVRIIYECCFGLLPAVIVSMFRRRRETQLAN